MIGSRRGPAISPLADAPLLSNGQPKPSPNTPYFPPSDTSTYRDLLLFEERLKMNAEMLRRRRRRYAAFLWTFVTALLYLAHWLIFLPPATMLSLRALQATVAVVFITLALFFASGMYEEKIRYAHSYINHSNRGLRQLNMHLNMRRQRPPLPAFLPEFLRPAPVIKPPSHLPSKPFNGSTIASRRPSHNATVMAQIPPSSNPRGELIFSSRVDKGFREGYERYRAAFERRREEKAREEARRNRKLWFRRKALNETPINRIMTPTPPASRRNTPPPGVNGATSAASSGTVPGVRRGRSPSPGPSSLGKVEANGQQNDGASSRRSRSNSEGNKYMT
ncbi:Spo7-like protein-domain-containing protein [Kockovaella imperatae]|uniref:Transmembrane protein 188 n=1 Tax=Kockovaella imperatae TaxID=4999 RepID=A0A1Y1UUI1_9TREE|nr:Spo7-like protein-domain-containing protein [Kockovaella imperatae]ORX41234.1 Spo7-like protein-domain-containing protein [Kockovaella imperatae]